MQWDISGPSRGGRDAIAFRDKHGRLAEFVSPTLDEIIRRDMLAALRSSVIDVEHRFFLALLLNVPMRDDILNLISQRFHDTPIDTLMRWVEELAETSDSGTSILDAEFPNELAIPLEQQSEKICAALRRMIDDRPGMEFLPPVPLSSTDVQRLRQSQLLRSTLKPLICSAARDEVC